MSTAYKVSDSASSPSSGDELSVMVQGERSRASGTFVGEDGLEAGEQGVAFTQVHVVPLRRAVAASYDRSAQMGDVDTRQIIRDRFPSTEAIQQQLKALIAERSRLIQESLVSHGEITSETKKKCAYVQWKIDNIEDALHGPTIDRMQGFAGQLRQIQDSIHALNASTKQSFVSNPSRKRTR